MALRRNLILLELAIVQGARQHTVLKRRREKAEQVVHARVGIAIGIVGIAQLLERLWRGLALEGDARHRPRVAVDFLERGVGRPVDVLVAVITTPICGDYRGDYYR